LSERSTSVLSAGERNSVHHCAEMSEPWRKRWASPPATAAAAVSAGSGSACSPTPPAPAASGSPDRPRSRRPGSTTRPTTSARAAAGKHAAWLQQWVEAGEPSWWRDFARRGPRPASDSFTKNCLMGHGSVAEFGGLTPPAAVHPEARPTPAGYKNRCSRHCEAVGVGCRRRAIPRLPRDSTPYTGGVGGMVLAPSAAAGATFGRR
jgi:hypothetical protein